MAWIDTLFRRMAQEGASDLHMTSGLAPLFRMDGEISPIENSPIITAPQMRQILAEITPPQNQKEYEEDNDTDFAYALEGVARFRCNLFQDHQGPGAVFRLIPSEVLTAEQLNLPPVILDFCRLSKGLVVVTGPTGSGKSTTLAAMIDYINKTRPDHILTIEDPIEFVHHQKRSLVNQREVGRHTNSFKRALRAALREDPDIVLVGEMRDLETIEIALETAETGHLVFGTLHTTTAASTVDRIIDQFPANRQSQIRTMLSGSMKGVVAQTLCKKIPKGRVAALETLVVNGAVSSQIREGKTHQIINSMQMGAKEGMRLLNDSLLELVQKGQVDPAEAYMKAVNKASLMELFNANGIQVRLDQPPPAAEINDAPAAALPNDQSGGGAPLGLANQNSGGAAPGGAGYADPFENFKQKKKR